MLETPKRKKNLSETALRGDVNFCFVHYSQFLPALSRRTGSIFGDPDSPEFIANENCLISPDTLLCEKDRTRIIDENGNGNDQIEPR